VTRRLIDRFLAAPDPANPRVIDRRLARLSDRESEVLTLLAQGMSNAEIAERLVLSNTTVKSRVASLLRKRELRDRVQAVVLAHELGITTIS
jgi:DNA-binding NarL/FixJ family response regulator